MYRIFWAVLILFLFAALLRQDWIYYLVYLVGGVWVVSHWWIRRALNRTTARRDMLFRAFAGEYIDVRLILQNGSWLPLPWLKVLEQAPLELKDQINYHYVTSLGGHATAEYNYRFYCKRRGYFAIGPLIITSGDLFGFTGLNWQEVDPPHVTVYPRIVSLEEMGLPSSAPFGVIRSNQRMFDDPARLAGVREYATGDSLRHIHWKASAHEDTLLVKKFQPAIALNVVIALDLDRGAYDHVQRGMIGYSEWAISVAGSVAAYLTRQRQPVGLVSNGYDPRAEATASPVPAHHGQGQLMNVLDLLARVELHTEGPQLAAWLPRQITDLAWGATLIVVTPRITDELLWVLHGTHRRGSRVVILACAPQPDHREMQAKADQLGVVVHRTIWEDDLKRVAETRI